MARRDYIAELAAKPPAFKFALLIGSIVVLGLLYWQLIYSGMSDDLTAERNSTKALQTKNEKLGRDLKEFKELVLQKKSLDEDLRRNQVSLPASSELPSFFLHLQKQAAGAGVKLDNWRRLKEDQIESYIKVPVSMEITGTFYQINNYFKLLYETERIITVENMTLEPRGSTPEEIRLVARFVASTFRLPDQPPDTDLPDAAEAAKPAGGRGQIKDANEKREGQLEGAAEPAPAPAPGGNQ